MRISYLSSLIEKFGISGVSLNKVVDADRLPVDHNHMMISANERSTPFSVIRERLFL